MVCLIDHIQMPIYGTIARSDKRRQGAARRISLVPSPARDIFRLDWSESEPAPYTGQKAETANRSRGGIEA